MLRSCDFFNLKKNPITVREIQFNKSWQVSIGTKQKNKQIMN